MTMHVVPEHENDDERSWMDRNRSKLWALLAIALALAACWYIITRYAAAHPPKPAPAPTPITTLLKPSRDSNHVS